MSIYLDYNATSPVDSRVLDVMIDVYKNHYGNPDSRTHDFGEDTRQIVESARACVAQLLGVKADEVIFTSGATESNNMVLLGLQKYAVTSKRNHIITTSIEHKAILEAAKHLSNNGFEINYINPDHSGRINASEVLSKVKDNTLLVSVMHVNNETGVIQPIDEIGKELYGSGVLFHTDATQSCGKLVEEIKCLKYDAMSIAAHKLNGPQGIGALILRKTKYKYPPVGPLLFGGGQEHGLRPGTVPVALVAGFGKACEIAVEEYQQDCEKYLNIKKELLRILNESGVEYSINGSQKNCIPNTLNISIHGVSSEALMLATKQFCGISNGSACTSKEYKASYVLTNMGLSQDNAESAIRISWGKQSEIEKVKESFEKTIMIAKKMTAQ